MTLVEQTKEHAKNTIAGLANLSFDELGELNAPDFALHLSINGQYKGAVCYAGDGRCSVNDLLSHDIDTNEIKLIEFWRQTIEVYTSKKTSYFAWIPRLSVYTTEMDIRRWKFDANFIQITVPIPIASRFAIHGRDGKITLGEIAQNSSDGEVNVIMDRHNLSPDRIIVAYYETDDIYYQAFYKV